VLTLDVVDGRVEIREAQTKETTLMFFSSLCQSLCYAIFAIFRSFQLQSRFLSMVGAMIVEVKNRWRKHQKTVGFMKNTGERKIGDFSLALLLLLLLLLRSPGIWP
jgi:hypothetical protein